MIRMEDQFVPQKVRLTYFQSFVNWLVISLSKNKLVQSFKLGLEYRLTFELKSRDLLLLVLI